MERVEIKDKFALTFEEANEYFGIGINKIRELAKNRSANYVLKIGRRTLIKREAFSEFLNKKFYI